jgi:hypothetical protein
MPLNDDAPPRSNTPSQPWFTLELDGVLLHVPMGDGKVFTLPMTSEGLYALIGEAVERWTALKGNSDLQKTIASKAASWLIDRLAGKR